MSDISKITTTNGTTYDIKDAKAYRLGATVRNRNTSINQDPVYVSLIPNKKTLECQTLIRAVGGAGDVFYSAYMNPNLTVECSYEGIHNVHASTLFSPGANATILVPVTDLSSNPFVVTVTKASNIGATDVMHLALFEHTLGNTAARLTDYKVELLTTGSTASTGDYSWQTVYQRSNVSDAINGLTIALNPTKYAYLYFKGVRFTVTGATPITTNSSGWGYNCFDLSLFQLISTRPDYTSARAIGALDINGGEVYGNVTFYGGITGNGASLTNLNANNIASGTVPVARLPVATSSANGVTKLYTGANSNAENTALTPASLHNMANESICPYYSTSATYAVGDKVRYNDNIYECITAIPTAEAWTAAHWQIAPTLQEQVTVLNSNLANINSERITKNQINVLDTSLPAGRYYAREATGVPSGVMAYGYLDIEFRKEYESTIRIVRWQPYDSETVYVNMLKESSTWSGWDSYALNSKYHREYVVITLNESGYAKWSYKYTEVTILSAFTMDRVVRYFTSTGDYWYFESSLWDSPGVLEVNKTIGLYVVYMDV